VSEPDALVVFTPSGKRGRFPRGTLLLQAARTLGVDVDSVCGGRALCGRCQVLVMEGEFPKHGLSSGAANLSAVSAAEESYSRRRPLAAGRRLSCSASIQGDLVVDVPAESQVHRQVVRKAADARPITLDPVVHLHYVEVREPDMHDPAGILADAGLAELIDLARPVCVILSAVLHFVDAPAARDIAAAFAGAIVPGSYLIISVGSGSRSEGENFTSAYTAAQIHIHSPEEIQGFFGGLDLLPPGVVPVRSWSDGDPTPNLKPRTATFLAGVAGKPE